MERTQREQPRRWGLLPLCFLPVALLSLVALAGCRPARQAPPPAAVPPRPAAQGPAPQHYPTLASDPARKAVLTEYLQAWRARDQAPQDFAAARSRLLDLYAEAYHTLAAAAPGPEYDTQLRLLWDLCGVAHATAISPKLVREAVHWQEPPEFKRAPLEEADPAREPLRLRLQDLPGRTWALLQAVPQEPDGKASWADYVAAQARQVYLTPALAEWSPNCPLEVCGSSEPLTRTLILAPVSYVDLAPKQDWQLAAVAVHEAAHVAWFYRPEVSQDPRLLLPVPNERQAWRLMAQFLRGLRQVADPTLRAYVESQAQPLREELAHAREQLRQANLALGRPEHDQEECTELPAGISQETLRGAAAAPGPGR
jgi:hypothetical protein